MEKRRPSSPSPFNLHLQYRPSEETLYSLRTNMPRRDTKAYILDCPRRSDRTLVWEDDFPEEICASTALVPRCLAKERFCLLGRSEMSLQQGFKLPSKIYWDR
jgi:hypothetical protein